MEDEHIDQTNESRQMGTTGSDKTLKETFKSGSPDDVRDRVKDVVQKGVAAVAGALKGFADETERAKVPEMSKNAVHQAGETIRTTASSVTEEAQNLKEPLKDAGHKLSQTARDLRTSAQEEYRSAKDAMKGSGTSSGSLRDTGSGSPAGGTLGGSSPELDASSSGMSSTGLGTEMPDISHTPLVESDRKLLGKDLTKDLDEDKIE